MFKKKKKLRELSSGEIIQKKLNQILENQLLLDKKIYENYKYITDLNEKINLLIKCKDRDVEDRQQDKP